MTDPIILGFISIVLIGPILGALVTMVWYKTKVIPAYTEALRKKDQQIEGLKFYSLSPEERAQCLSHTIREVKGD